ncbi:MAG: hypothetical protein K0U93_02325 [Gammaproteobacteria bacterium]|nr:hypothetical protein [Gammaproteobacteria bacterium]
MRGVSSRSVTNQKVLAAWTVESLAERIRLGERFLEELACEPRWMSDVLQTDLQRKRAWLRELQANGGGVDARLSA